MRGKSIWDLSEHEFIKESRKLVKRMAENGYHINNAFIEGENGRLVVDTTEGTYYELQQLIGEGEFALNVSDVTLKVKGMHAPRGGRSGVLPGEGKEDAV